MDFILLFFLLLAFYTTGFQLYTIVVLLNELEEKLDDDIKEAIESEEMSAIKRFRKMQHQQQKDIIIWQHDQSQEVGDMVAVNHRLGQIQHLDRY